MSERICGHKFLLGSCDVCSAIIEANTQRRLHVVHNKRRPFDVYIGRPGPWGNPYTHDKRTQAEHVVGTREEAIECYRQWMEFRLYTAAGTPPDHPDRGLAAAIASLHGKVLGCWCAPQPCHGDVLYDLARQLVEGTLVLHGTRITLDRPECEALGCVGSCPVPADGSPE